MRKLLKVMVIMLLIGTFVESHSFIVNHPAGREGEIEFYVQSNKYGETLQSKSAAWMRSIRNAAEETGEFCAENFSDFIDDCRKRFDNFREEHDENVIWPVFGLHNDGQ